ncbi:hypothetical protein BDW59DRAFT_141948 [Aspergillus cavernicola]|uniref:Secreted protein n=1 Tax=Aspergillus cavernicola TaxID=176166 RepID=A0ABR4ISA3_9EURO
MCLAAIAASQFIQHRLLSLAMLILSSVSGHASRHTNHKMGREGTQRKSRIRLSNDSMILPVKIHASGILQGEACSGAPLFVSPIMAVPSLWYIPGASFWVLNPAWNYLNINFGVPAPRRRSRRLFYFGVSLMKPPSSAGPARRHHIL